MTYLTLITFRDDIAVPLGALSATAEDARLLTLNHELGERRRYVRPESALPKVA